MRATLLLFILYAGAGQATELSETLPNTSTRYYTPEQVILGKQVFEKNCQICHGKNAEGESSQWKKRRKDDTFPAPPLDGSAHTWHHSQAVLLRTINEGGIPLGGRMPPFEGLISDDEKRAVLAYIQNLWSEDIYNAWMQNNRK